MIPSPLAPISNQNPTTPDRAMDPAHAVQSESLPQAEELNHAPPDHAADIQCGSRLTHENGGLFPDTQATPQSTEVKNPDPVPNPNSHLPNGRPAAAPVQQRMNLTHGYGGSFPSSTPTYARPSAGIQKPPRRRSSQRSSTVRGSGFTQVETDNLLDIIERMLPLCADEWNAVLAEHNKCFGDQRRTVDSLKRKFSTLHRKKMPTGDPQMPDDVRRAKHIRFRMTERAAIGFGDEEADELAGLSAEMESSEQNTPSPEVDDIGSRDVADALVHAQAPSGSQVIPQSPL